jgi:hypothetical protein
MSSATAQSSAGRIRVLYDAFGQISTMKRKTGAFRVWRHSAAAVIENALEARHELDLVTLKSAVTSIATHSALLC